MEAIEVTFLRDNHADNEAWYQVVVPGRTTFKVSITQTQKASGPPSPEYRIKENTREQLLDGTLPPHGAIVSIGYEIDPRYF